MFDSLNVFDRKPYKLGLALSGGAARGFAHLGAYQKLLEVGMIPDLIAGTSAGALSGVFFADGYMPMDIVRLFEGKEFSFFAKWQVPKVGLFDMRGMRDFLISNLHARTFEELKIPLRVVTTNLDTGEMVVFDKGPLIKPILASCCVPIVFNPIVIDGVHYIDGGVVRNFPVREIREDCEKVIGVNVTPLIAKEYKKTLLYIAERAYHYMFTNNTLADRKLCDILIELQNLESVKTFDLDHASDIANLGYMTADQVLGDHEDKQKLPFWERALSDIINKKS
ncbi:MAG: patatin-like phospholipase family protein [Massilibacteroides sp.]|nr:patatin-like phospholipase family protein [Massilibacteroides sp.]